ncbi:MAG: methyltransferase domain-containing protein, partial [Candidatus Poribacteria bacterium]|nr:methyltransferase domain-containing protein [Candidatus Poribacteria bacterium]
MQTFRDEEIRQAVRETYGKIAESEGTFGCCGTEPSTNVAGGCCGIDDTACGTDSPEAASVRLGYSDADASTVPQGANMGLGCGNPQAIASLKPGETVLDLGSGGGFDCFLAAEAVGENGHVIGVDMTPAMITKARKNAVAGGFRNVEFRLGEIEHLPVPDNAVDV